MNFSFYALLISCLIFFNSTAFSQSQIDHHFEDFFDSDELSSRHCADNTRRFMIYLGKKGLNIHNKVTIVRMESPHNPWSFGRVVAVKARWGNSFPSGIRHINYEFHVFAIYDGKVYDFSFEEQATVLPVEDYLYAMYVPSVNNFMPYGENFSTRGLGAIYKPSYALEELKSSTFTLMSTDAKGNLTITGKNLSFQEAFPGL